MWKGKVNVVRDGSVHFCVQILNLQNCHIGVGGLNNIGCAIG